MLLYIENCLLDEGAVIIHIRRKVSVGQIPGKDCSARIADYFCFRERLGIIPTRCLKFTIETVARYPCESIANHFTGGT